MALRLDDSAIVPGSGMGRARSVSAVTFNPIDVGGAANDEVSW
jgi:hypothetical protein